MEIKKELLGRLCNVSIGRTPPRAESNWFNGGSNDDWKWVSIKDMGNCSRHISNTSETITNNGQKRFNIPVVKKGTVLVSFKLTVGRLAITDCDMLTNEAIAQLPIINKNELDRDYLYYYLKSYPWSTLGSTSSIATAVNSQLIKQMIIEYPSIKIQKKIAAILSSIDDKIEVNNKINFELEVQAEAIYNEYFNAEEENDSKKTLDEFCSIFTGRKNANENSLNGKYKFFTCAPDALLIDSFIYDGNAIIVSGNGAYTGRTRFYSGKFDLYQRTYACVIKNDINGDYIFPLYWFVKINLSKKISGGTRGSAIPYIVMNDLAKHKFNFNEEKFRKYLPIFKDITLKQLDIEEENKKLAELRDALLPKLMSGEIDVENLDI